MTFLRNLWRDLVDKRLWPVAVALLLAAIAVPFLIPSGSSTPAPVAPAAVATAPAQADGVTVAVAESDTPHARSGKARNPFKPEVFAKVAKTAATGGTAAGTSSTPAATSSGSTSSGAGSSASTSTGSSSGGSSSGTGSSAAGGSTSGPATVTPARPTTVKRKWFANTITLQLKRAGKKTRRTGVKAITYLPSPDYPLLAFLGNSADGRRATFAVMDGVVVSGPDRVCRPSRAHCELVELGLNDELLFTKPPADPSKAKHYRLTIRRIGYTEVPKLPTSSSKTKASTRAKGAAAKAPKVALAPAGSSGR